MPPETHQISTAPSGAEPGFGPATNENTGVTDEYAAHHENPDNRLSLLRRVEVTRAA